ncbi:MAG: site-2 protease family protein [Actinomycetota bacterium]|nr:site-2 protease family protein [Actinomycetota bacterium]
MGRGGITLGSIYGIKIILDYSWFIIFAIIIFILSFSLFPQLIPGFGASTYIVIGIITSIFFFSSVLAHELVHSIIAKMNGINVESITLIIFGGISRITEEPRTPGVEFKISIAGPLSSIVLGAIFFSIFFVASRVNLGLFIVVPALWLGYINVALGLFNLLPGFPLDGGRVFRSAIWYFTGSLRRSTAIASAVGKGIAYTMIIIGIVGPLFFGLISLLWFVLLGWYLLRAAEAGYEQVLYHEALEKVKVSEIMTENPVVVDPRLSIADMVSGYFMRLHYIGYPAVENGGAKGLITIDMIRDIPRDQWPIIRVSDVMRPLSPDIVTNPDAQVFDILPKLSRADGRLLVMKDGQLVGIITAADIRRAIVRRLHLEETGRPAA